ncbi:hypothetical protein B0H13DRAFT_2344883 [Mycena leptocephala]|nr:hypothetical protein B0H13DRAFT_2344883 [Mycena leptocephala]
MAKSGQKRARPRIPKESRKNLRLWAEGARETILAPHLDDYAKALDQGWQHERKYLKKVCREFHARVNWRVQDHEEPELGEWDPSAPVVAETLTDEEEKARGRRVKELNKRIRRWFTYRIRKLYKHRISSGLDPSKNPFAVLLAKLSGVTAPPKARQAYQQFMHESYAEKIAPVVAERWSRLRDRTVLVSPNAPRSRKRDFVQSAGEGSRSGSKEAYTKSLKDRPSMKPEDRQRCIDALADFVAPILRGIEEYTGLHSTICVEAQCPVTEGISGRFSNVSYGHSNTMLGPHWPQWDRPQFATNVMNFMVEYLQTAFTPQDCIWNALAPALAGANYTISPQDDSDSESGSESESESDSDIWSDEEEERCSRKKARLSQDKTMTAGKRHSGNKKIAGKAKARTKTKPQSPNPSSLRRICCTKLPTPPRLLRALSHDEPQPHDDREPDNREEQRRRELAHQSPVLHADLKVAWQEVTEPLKAARAKQPKPRKVKQLPVGSLRRSTRNTAEGMDGDVVMADNPPDVATPSTATGNAGVTTSTHSSTDVEMGDIPPDVNPLPALRGALIITSDLHHLTTTPSTSTGSAGGTTSTGLCTTDGNTAAPTTPSMSIVATTPSAAIGSSGGSTSTDPCTIDGNATAAIPTTSTSIGTAAGADTSPTAMTATDALGTSTTELAPVSQAAQAAIATRSRRSTRAASRAREGEGSEYQIPTPCPSNAPAWFVDGYAAVTENDLGCHFHALVAAWTRIEAASRFEHGPTNLPSKYRPKPMSEWIAKGRGHACRQLQTRAPMRHNGASGGTHCSQRGEKRGMTANGASWEGMAQEGGSGVPSTNGNQRHSDSCGLPVLLGVRAGR